SLSSPFFTKSRADNSFYLDPSVSPSRPKMHTRVAATTNTTRSIKTMMMMFVRCNFTKIVFLFLFLFRLRDDNCVLEPALHSMERIRNNSWANSGYDEKLKESNPYDQCRK